MPPSVIKNFKEVIETRDIDRMNKELYHFLTLYCGFIAHYDINGFKAIYKAPRDFAEVFIRHFDREHRYYSGIYACHQEPYKDTGMVYRNEYLKKLDRIFEMYTMRSGTRRNMVFFISKTGRPDFGKRIQPSKDIFSCATLGLGRFLFPGVWR